MKPQYAILIQKAQSMAKEAKHSRNCKSGQVGCALITAKGNIYTGKNIQSDCGIGLCAEQGTIATMMAKGESRIKLIVAVSHDGKIVPPCGKCREFLFQVNNQNLDAEIVISKTKTVKLRSLLPNRWQDIYFG